MPWKIASSRKAYLHGAIFLGLLQNTFVMLTVFRKTRAALSILNVSSSYRSAFAWLDGWTQRQFNKSLFWALSDKPFFPLTDILTNVIHQEEDFALNYLAMDTEASRQCQQQATLRSSTIMSTIFWGAYRIHARFWPPKTAYPLRHARLRLRKKI